MASAREISILIPNENDQTPMHIARELVATIGVGDPVFGVDALTGAVEVRLIFEEETLRRARNFLIGRRVVFDISLQ